MEFYILRNQLIITGPQDQLTSSLSSPGLIGRSLNVPKAEIQAFKNDDGTDNQKYAERLTSALVENPWSLKKSGGLVDWNLKAAIFLPKPSRGQARVDQPGNLRIFVESPREGPDFNFLEVLHNIFNVEGGGGHAVTVNVVVKNFGPRKRSQEHPSVITFKVKGLILIEMSGKSSTVIECNCPLMSSRSPTETKVLVAWENGEQFSGTFTVSVVLNNSALCLLNSINQVPREGCGHLKEMLEKEICTDLEIHAGLSPNHRAIKCHRAILAVGSTVFQRMFENGMKEATENKIEIEEMSEEGVRALLAYLYHREIKAAYGSSNVALELLEAGEKYDIQELKDTVREFMMAKESVWFGADVVLALYVFVRELCLKKEAEIVDEETQDDDDDGDIEMETCEDEDEEMEAWKSLKLKCLKTLKWYSKKKPQTLLGSAKYQEIFRGNLKLAMEINTGIFRLD